MSVRPLLTMLATGLVAVALFFLLPTEPDGSELSDREAYEKMLNEI